MDRHLDNRRQWYGTFARWLAVVLLGGGGVLLARRNGALACRSRLCAECGKSATCTQQPSNPTARQRP